MGLTLTPLLARLGRDAAVRIERRGQAAEPDVTPTREEPRAVIIGFGRVGRLVAEMLAAARQALSSRSIRTSTR